jgi:hypothetical protein
MFFLKILFTILLLQLSIVGVFSFSEDSYYVINTQENLCGDFVKWTSWNSNWLPNNWEAIYLNPELDNDFLENIACLESDIAECCVSQGYRYAWIPIWIETISDERKWAEILWAKKIIESKSFNPSEYNLNANISRKELMKIIMNISWIEVQDTCREIFTDVDTDWSCKYIESALENNYIEWNDLFRPNDNVTKTEALKLIFKAKNIEKAYNTDYWQEDYISTAYYLGYIDQKYSNYNEIATRWWIFSVAGKTFSEFSSY